MLLHQEAGEYVGVLSLGSGAASKLNTVAWARRLLPIPHYLVAYDDDPAGLKGGQSLMGISKRMRPAPIEGGSDITEMHQNGVCLRSWVLRHLEDINMFDEERAAIMEFDGGLSRQEAERYVFNRRNAQ
jgi:hypothetical protein